jgi:hypothetical protein
MNFEVSIYELALGARYLPSAKSRETTRESEHGSRQRIPPGKKPHYTAKS